MSVFSRIASLNDGIEFLGARALSGTVRADPVVHDHYCIRALLDARRSGHTLPQPFYTDPDLFRSDVDSVFGRSWIAVGFECEVAEPGFTLGSGLIIRARM